MVTTMAITADITGVIITGTIMEFIPTADPGTVQDSMMDTVLLPARISTRDGQPVSYTREPGPLLISPVQQQVERDPPTANPAASTEKTTFIQTVKELSIAKREITGKHVKEDPGRKAMYRQPERQILTNVLKVQLVRQRGKRLQRKPHEVLLLGVAPPIVQHREAHTTRVERVAEAIRADVIWVVNHRLAVKEVNELIHTRKASSSRKKVRQIVQGAQAQKARLVKLPREVAADQKAVPEANKGVDLQTEYFKRTGSVVYHWVLFSFSFSVPLVFPGPFYHQNLVIP